MLDRRKSAEYYEAQAANTQEMIADHKAGTLVLPESFFARLVKNLRIQRWMARFYRTAP